MDWEVEAGRTVPLSSADLAVTDSPLSARHRPASRRSERNRSFGSEGSKGQIRKEGCSSELNDPARPTADRTVSTPSDSAGKAQNIQVITKLLYYILLDIYIYIYIYSIAPL